MTRISYRSCSIKKDVLKNFAKFTWKHLCNRVSFLIKLQKKKETLAQVFSCEFCRICKNTFLYRTPPEDCFWMTWYHSNINECENISYDEINECGVWKSKFSRPSKIDIRLLQFIWIFLSHFRDSFFFKKQLRGGVL